MAKKRLKNTLKSDVKRLVKFKKSIGQKANYGELYSYYKKKGRINLDNRSFRFTDDAGRFTSIIDYQDEAVKEILSFAKSKRNKKESEKDLRQAYRAALENIYKRRKKKNPKITMRDIVQEAKTKSMVEVDEDSRPVYRAVTDLLKHKFEKNKNLKIMITDSEGKTESFKGKDRYHNAQALQSTELSKAWKIVRDRMNDEKDLEVSTLTEQLDEWKSILEMETQLRKEGKMGIYDDEGDFVSSVKLNLRKQESFMKTVRVQINETEDEIDQAEKKKRTPLQKIPVTTINDLTGKPMVMKINYNDIRGGEA